MKSPIRCAIYTRKSTEEGLEQEFNSLHAQRESCESYISSQVGEGWVILSKLYDDGGYSGGTLERPALQELLGDIDQGLIDVVVVYKIDRLTRALAGFAKLVECFDRRKVSFVSVTQAFSTTTSMGRLTLNVLLSFAQFERELTAERIRDKFAASRAKGIFMGGNPPLGYDAKERKLVINKAEAKQVRHIFARYLELSSLAKLRRDLVECGIRSKSWISTRGRQMGGGPWYVGSLSHFLQNRVYIGEVVYKGNVFPGRHEAIVPRTLFDEVQARLERNRTAYKRKTGIGSMSLLTGLIFDQFGNAMSPKTSRRPGAKTYTYYVSQATLQNAGPHKNITRPVAAPLIEDMVTQKLSRVLHALGSVPSRVKDSNKDEVDFNDCKDGPDPRCIIRRYVSRIVIGDAQTKVHFQQLALQGDSALDGNEILERLRSIIRDKETFEIDDDNLILKLDQPLPRNGGRKCLKEWDTTDWKTQKRKINPKLVKALTRAHVWRDLIEADGVKSLSELSKKTGVERSHLRATLHLAFLAPDIAQAILSGRQPQALTLSALLDANLPSSWAKQRQFLGLI